MPEDEIGEPKPTRFGRGEFCRQLSGRAGWSVRNDTTPDLLPPSSVVGKTKVTPPSPDCESHLRRASSGGKGRRPFTLHSIATCRELLQSLENLARKPPVPTATPNKGGDVSAAAVVEALQLLKYNKPFCWIAG